MWPELPPSNLPTMTSTVRPFRPVCGTDVKLKFSAGSMRPRKPNATVVTELEFSASSATSQIQAFMRARWSGWLTEYTILDDEDRI